jgi:acyl-CoA reductase-like NAD-dependent aldehyde dehydrogenase
MYFYVRRFKTEDEAVKIANSVDVGLAGIRNTLSRFNKTSFNRFFSLFL